MPHPILEIESLDEAYERVCSTPSDINEHCPVLSSLASECNRVVELGVRYGTSTVALLHGLREQLPGFAQWVTYKAERTHREHSPYRRLMSYDLVCQIDTAKYETMANACRIEFIFSRANSLFVTILPCDMLFIDTLHTAGQLHRELERHSPKVGRIIALHDTETFGRIGEDGGQGLSVALDAFLAANPEWQVSSVRRNNNGLTVLRKKVSV